MITRSRGRDLQVRSFALSDMVRWGYSGLRNIKPGVGEKQAKGIPALNRAVRLRAEAVASLKLYCWRGDGPTRQRVDTVWQSRLFKNGPQPTATNPVQTRFSFWETVEESLAWRGNAYIWKNKDSGRVVEWWALHPDQVTPQYDGHGNIQYRIEVAPGYVDPVGEGKGIYLVDEGTILHVRGHGEGGQLTAPSPIEVFKLALEGPIGRQRHEARVWRRGTALQQAVTLPANVGKEQADQWREVWRANYEGADGETTVVLGGGMEIKPIGMTLQDAQFVEAYDLTAKDASSIMGVPANLLGVQVTHVRTNLEDDLMAWLRFGLGPELGRIEEALYADTDLFGGSQTEPGFDTSDFVRGDLATEATILIGLVQSGILTPNEGRHKLGYEHDDSPESDQLQQTPVGGAANTDLNLPKLKPSAGETPDDNTGDEGRTVEMPEFHTTVNLDTSPLAREVDALRSALVEQAQTAAKERRASDAEVEQRRRDDRAKEAAELRERDERLAAALEREQPAPVVNVDVKVPEQAPPEIRVDMPAQPAPMVNVDMQPVAEAMKDMGALMADQKPPEVHVHPESGRKRAKVKRGPNGFIDELTIEETDG